MPNRVGRLAVLLASWCALMAPALLLAARATTPPQGIALRVELPDQPTAGARLFARKHCVRCHALGTRQTRVGPDLGRMAFTGTVMDLAGALWNHSPVMREKMHDLKIQPPSMTGAEMADVIAFLTAYRYYLTQLGEPGNSAAGAKVFEAKGCSRCHDPAASNWNKTGPSLWRYRGGFSGISLAQTMWNHGAEMAFVMRATGVPWPQFTGHEMGDLLAYLQTGNGGRSDERTYLEPGSPRRGQELFVRKRCRDCHAIAGSGGRVGPDLARSSEFMRSVPEIAGLMWNHSQGMTAEFARRRIPRATFSDQEMADIIAYLYYTNYATVRGTPARGATLFRARCAACHSVGAGAVVGADLSKAPGLDEPFAIIAAMWNNAPRMEQEMRARGFAWPRFAPGDAADLAAFLLSQRAGAPVAPIPPPQ